MTGIKIVNYTEDTLADGCNLALKNRLYVSGWRLSKDLKNAREKKQGEISIVFKNDTPVALAFADKCSYISTFCKKSERRKGYGSLAVQSLNCKEIAKGSYGIDGSETFYTKNKIKYIG